MANFNEDVLMEIFSWLSAKNLSKFSLVSRSVDDLRSDDFFIRKQFRNMRILGDSDFFVQSHGYNETLQLHGNYNVVNPSSLISPCKTDEFVGGFGKILATFNGLICSRKDEQGPLFVFNPATRSCIHVPVPTDKGHFDVVFAEEERGSVFDYSLFSVVPSSEWGGESRFMVFSPRQRIWKNLSGVDFGGRNMAFDLTVQVKGILYFVSDSELYFAAKSRFFWSYIVAYDTKDHTSKLVKIPKNARKGSWDSNLAIFEWGRRRSTICLVRFWRGMFTIWALGDSCWKRVFHMRIKAMGLSGFDRGIVKICCYTILNGTNLLVATNQKLYSYDLMGGTKAKIQEVCEHDFAGAKVRIHSVCGTLSRCGPVDQHARNRHMII
ncbi:F-box protein At5g49610-like [Henckelia pumila]|uniref:F-box protein At5g49610-like n=1 Tax=Henckelia pumila TaxID=405737 RepID=UPI003C6E565B